MPNPSLSRELAEEAVRRYEDALRSGGRHTGMSGTGRSALALAGETAVQDGWINTVNAFASRLRAAREVHRLEPDETLYRPRQYLHRSPGAPTIPDQSHIVEDEPDGEPECIGIIGDAHDSPHLRDKSRFTWLGRFFADNKVDRVVSVGDWMSLDCFSTHTDRGTFEGLAKPTFAQDLESLHQSQRAFQDGLGGWKPKKDIVFGNHEHRAWRYDNLHPEALPHSLQIEEAFMQWGWRTTPYGQYRFIQGVGFVHIPMNGLGKPLAQGQRANKALCDTIHGDDHKHLTLTDHKSGPFRSPTVYSAATALPPGHIEGYANKGGSTWRTGACIATVWGGYVRSWSFTEMVLLRKRYS